MAWNIKKSSLICLDQTGYFDVYGPKKSWTDLPSYKGSIAFDHKEFLNAIRKSGVGLIFHNKEHYLQNIPSTTQYVAPALFFFIVIISTNRNLLFKFICTIVISVLTIFSSSYIIDKFSVNNNSWQLRQFFDIAAIVVDLDDDSVLPDYVKDYKGYNFKTLKNKFTHKIVDNLIFPENRVHISTHDPKKLKQLNNNFFDLITAHPFLYLKHRSLNFSMQMIATYSKIHDKRALDELEVHYFNNHFLQETVFKFLSLYLPIFRANLISLILVIIYAYESYKVKNYTNTEKQVLTYVVIIGLIFSITNFLTCMASVYRYYYFIHLLTFFTIPIYLKLRLINKAKIT